MFVNDAVLERAHHPDALFLFIHAQRTGGSNTIRWLRGVFGDEASYTHQTVENFRRWNELDDVSPLDGFRLHGGFSRFTDIDLKGRPLIGLSNVRHPFYRTLSIYRMSRKNTTQFLHEVAIVNDFEDFYRIGHEINPGYFDNVCATRIAGSADWDRLLESLESNFGLVATTNRLREATRALIKRLGWDARPIKAAKSPPDPEHYAASEASPVRDLIIERNQLDLRLYELIAGKKAAPPKQPPAIPSISSRAPAADDGFAQYDAPFRKARETEPDLSFSRFYTRRVASKLRKGQSHNSLGPNIVSKTYGQESFDTASARQMRKIERVVAVAPEHRVVEYGCGSLRTAAGLIERTAPRHYLGLDVIADFYEMGLGHLDQRMIEEKQPWLAEIGEGSVDAAAAFGADLVVSLSVMMHVHPDDLDAYIDDLARIAGKPGARIVLDAALAERSVRYNSLGWARPLEWIEARFGQRGLVLIDTRLGRPHHLGGHEVTVATLCFLRESANGDPGDIGGRAIELAASETLLAGHRREYLRELDPGFGFARVRLTVTIPQMPAEARGVSFGEHVQGRRTVIGLRPGAVVLSEDLGETWRVIELPEAEGAPFARCFTTANGFHLLQTAARDADDPEGMLAPMIYRYTPEWTFAGRCEVGRYNWHGRASIGQAGDTIMWAEYPFNRSEHIPGGRDPALAARVWRSRDDGRSWNRVLELPGDAIRHFHTVCPDPYFPRQWWLSSGDRTDECRVWLSRDDGDSWTEATNTAPSIRGVRSGAQASQRFTDMAFTEDALIWGSDDWLGSSKKAGERGGVGARMFSSPRSVPLAPRSIGWIGNPVRSMVDVGPAWLVMTEAKHDAFPEPQICLVAKDGETVQELLTIDLAERVGTGFSYSRASAQAEDGHFFSFRGARDLASSTTRLFHWQIEFD